MNAQAQSPSYLLAARLYLRGLGLVFAIAFYSFYTQMEGLVGPRGILPLDALLSQVSQARPGIHFYEFPTLSLYFSSWSFFKGLVLGATILSVLVALFPRLSYIYLLLWLAYLSVCVNGQIFLGYQWDNLLLECGFLAFLISFCMNIDDSSNNTRKISVISSVIMRLILFKLMFSSGIVKLTYGDPSWLDLSALRYHFLTQPLPTRFSWNFDHYSDNFLTFLCGLTYLIEILVPFLYFFGKKLRIFSFLMNFLLMFFIFLTGNYNFFNILTILLSLFLLDDSILSHCCAMPKLNHSYSSLIKYIIINISIICFITLSFIQILQAVRPGLKSPALIAKMEAIAQPFRTVNSYGLFRIMTTERREICLQGSNTPEDEKSWKTYTLKAKPGPLDRAPVWVQPLQPRLDWQLWFAALSSYQREPWYLNFLIRLLQAEPSVLGLLEHDPFNGDRPKYVRGLLHRYTFSQRDDLNRGVWWSQKELGVYSPPIYLR